MDIDVGAPPGASAAGSGAAPLGKGAGVLPGAVYFSNGEQVIPEGPLAAHAHQGPGPCGMPHNAPPPTLQVAGATPACCPKAPPSLLDVPEGRVAYRDDASGDTYYYHPTTGA